MSACVYNSVDELSCFGAQRLRFDEGQGLWVGTVSCEDEPDAVPGMLRLYLSEDGETFYPATDTAGHGQDHCELINENFSPLANPDDITSGGCDSCSTSENLPLENQPVFNRTSGGEPFYFVHRSGEWSYQTSRLNCGPTLCDEDPYLYNDL